MKKLVARISALSFALILSCGLVHAQDDDAIVDTPVEDKWALIVGISNFADSHLDLKFPAKDASDFASYLINEGHFASDHVHLLTDENATKERILTELGDRWLPRVAHANDLVVIFISSHGSPSTMDVVGTNYVVAYNTDVNRLYATGLPMQELTSAIKERVHARRVVLILDACHSGAARTAKGLTRTTNFDTDAVAQGTGQLVICSSSADQVSWESERYDNGVFTAQLLAALRSQADKTRLGQAFNMLKENVESEVLKDRGESQTPVMKMKWEGNDLVLAAVPAKPRKTESDAPSIAVVPGTSKTITAGDAQSAPTTTDPQLEVRRLTKLVQDEGLPGMQKDLDEIVQAKVVWDIDWQSFSSSLTAIQNLQYQGLDRILQAARTIASDSLGKSAIKGALKKIVVHNVHSMDKKRVTFSKGTLEMDCPWELGAWDGYPSVDQIRTVIENGL